MSGIPIPEHEWIPMRRKLDQMWMAAEDEIETLFVMSKDETIPESTRTVIALVIAEIIDRRYARASHQG